MDASSSRIRFLLAAGIAGAAIAVTAALSAAGANATTGASGRAAVLAGLGHATVVGGPLATGLGFQVAGWVLQAAALNRGALTVVQPLIFVSILLGITVFDETLSHDNGHLIPAIIGLVLTFAGIVLLAAAKPPERSRAHARARTDPSPKRASA